MKGASEHQETHSALPISSETDRVYKSLNPEKPISVLEGGNQRYEITRDGLDDVVVWNPWAEKAAAMSDLGPKDAWKGMSECNLHIVLIGQRDMMLILHSLY